MSRLFNGSSDYMALGSAVLTAAPLSMACWFNNTTNANAYPCLMSAWTSGGTDNRFALGLDVAEKVEAFTRNTANASALSSTIYTANTWNHACGVWSAVNSRSAFLNGAGKATNTTSQTPTGINRFNLGAINDGVDSVFTGYISHAAVWNVALTDDEVAMLGVGRVSPLLVRPQSLVLYTPYLGRDSSDIDIIGGSVLSVTGATSSAEEPPMLWTPGRRRIFVASSGLILALSGSSASGSAGLLVPSSSKSVSGSAVIASAGTLPPGISKSVSGSAITASADSIAPQRSVGLTGASIASASGLVTALKSIGISGTGVVSATGTVTVSISGNVTVSLAGINFSSSVGVPTLSLSKPLIGEQSLFASGTLKADRSVGISGLSVAASLGVIGLLRNSGLLGSLVTSSTDAFGVLRDSTLLGSSLVSSSGIITISTGGNVTLALSGAELTSVLGTLSVYRDLILDGHPASFSSGIIDARIPVPLATVPYGTPEALPASANPRASTVPGYGILSAGVDGLIIGRFAWIDAELKRANNQWSVGQILGFVPAVQSTNRALYVGRDGLLRLRAGSPATLMAGGDFWARFPNGTVIGDRVYASLIDGAVVSGQTVDAMPTQWRVATNAAPGELAIISTWM